MGMGELLINVGGGCKLSAEMNNISGQEGLWKKVFLCGNSIFTKRSEVDTLPKLLEVLK